MYRKILIFICLVSFLSFACKKERKTSGPTLINGKAIDITNGNTFKGIKIVLYEAGHYSKTPLDSTYTGNDGSFLFYFEAEKGKSYQLFAYGDEIIDHLFNSRYSIYEVGVESNVVMELFASAHLKLCFKNVTKKFENVYFSGPFSDSWGKGTLSGFNIDTCIIGKSYGNVMNLVHWNADQSMDTAIYCKTNDTTTLMIEY